MKEFVISEVQAETAVLVGLITKTQDERKTNEYLDELAFLAETAGAEVVKRFTQKLDAAHSVTYVGKGKLEDGVKIRSFRGGQEFDELYYVNYYPNGMCEAYEIEIGDDENHVARIKVDAVTGKAKVERE